MSKLYVGHQKKEELPFKRGETVLIPKGAPYKTTYPGKDGIQYTKKAYKVKVHFANNGCEYTNYGEKVVHNPSVTWAGSGGYWCEMDINYIITPELIKKAP